MRDLPAAVNGSARPFSASLPVRNAMGRAWPISPPSPPSAAPCARSPASPSVSSAPVPAPARPAPAKVAGVNGTASAAGAATPSTWPILPAVVASNGLSSWSASAFVGRPSAAAARSPPTARIAEVMPLPTPASSRSPTPMSCVGSGAASGFFLPKVCAAKASTSAGEAPSGPSKTWIFPSGP